MHDFVQYNQEAIINGHTVIEICSSDLELIFFWGGDIHPSPN